MNEEGICKLFHGRFEREKGKKKQKGKKNKEKKRHGSRERNYSFDTISSSLVMMKMTSKTSLTH